MPSSANRKQIELPIDLHLDLARYAEGQHVGLARVAAVAVWEYLKREGGTGLSNPWCSDNRWPWQAAELISAAERRLTDYRYILGARQEAREVLRRYALQLDEAAELARAVVRRTHDEVLDRVQALLQLESQAVESAIVEAKCKPGRGTVYGLDRDTPVEELDKAPGRDQTP